LDFQDFSQLNRDCGDKESKVVQNAAGNIFSVGWPANRLKRPPNVSGRLPHMKLKFDKNDRLFLKLFAKQFVK
jgi:hypothetical protein